MAEQAAFAAPRAVDWRVLKAAVGGSAIASILLAIAFGIDADLHPSGGPLNFSGPLFVTMVFLIGLLIGSVMSLIALSLAIAIVGGERLAGVSPIASALIGAVAGILLMWIALGIGTGEWDDYMTIGFGAIYGGSVAGLWSRLVRR